MIRLVSSSLSLLLVLTFSSPVGAVDGPVGMAPGPAAEVTTYYEAVGAEGAALDHPALLPTRLYLSDSQATATYASAPDGSGGLDWTVRLRGLQRNHEQVDGVYHLLLLLPLPGEHVEAGHRIDVREGAEGSSVPLIYGGEKVSLKRSLALESALLPGLEGSLPGQLPSLAGTGYRFTIWDTILGYDPQYGDTVQALADFSFRTSSDVAAPDPDDDRQQAYLVVWLPGLDPSIPPFAIRIDVAPSAD